MSVAPEFKICEGVISEVVPLGETVFMNVHTLTYFGLDTLGSRLWRAVRETQDFSAAVAAVAEETGMDPERLARTLESVLAGMERSGLIVRPGAPESGAAAGSSD
ncbi:PqqD family peptide modification chaperone [Elongatibacter sediminis]|uniref:PqqD family peptide modification chaperone n=1 Tax=Elongatibacter sediminis TaxID=3119006 RepID=A0AAW9RGK3_9GAMM